MKRKVSVTNCWSSHQRDGAAILHAGLWLGDQLPYTPEFEVGFAWKHTHLFFDEENGQPVAKQDSWGCQQKEELSQPVDHIRYLRFLLSLRFLFWHMSLSTASAVL